MVERDPTTTGVRGSLMGHEGHDINKLASTRRFSLYHEGRNPKNGRINGIVDRLGLKESRKRNSVAGGRPGQYKKLTDKKRLTDFATRRFSQQQLGRGGGR